MGNGWFLLVQKIGQITAFVRIRDGDAGEVWFYSRRLSSPGEGVSVALWDESSCSEMRS